MTLQHETEHVKTKNNTTAKIKQYLKFHPNQRATLEEINECIVARTYLKHCKCIRIVIRKVTHIIRMRKCNSEC